MSVLKKINQKLGKVERFLISWGIIAMAVVLMSNAIGRTIFNHSFKWAEEISQFLVLLVTFIGLSNAARHGTHVVMSSVLDAMPFKGKKIMSIIVSVFTGVFLVFLTYLSTGYVNKVHEYGRITPALGIPFWLVVSLMPIGCALGALQYILAFIMNITEKDTIYVGAEKTYEQDAI